MKIRVIFLFCVFLCSLLSASACLAAGIPIVFVSIVPQKFFVQQIGRGLVDVELMVQPGASPATYEPRPSQMAKLSSSSAYLAIGIPFEKTWIDRFRAVNPSMKIIHTDGGIKKIAMAEHLHDEAHREGGRPDGILDPHIWLSPTLVKKQAMVILATLKELVPEHAADFDLNHHSFIEQIDTLDGELRRLFEGKEGMQFMVFHPSWGYFARDYGLEQVAIEMEGKEPKPGQLREIIQHAEENNIQVIFAQRQFSLKNAKVVAKEINGEVIPVDPLAEDWFGNMRDVAEKFILAVK